eukprot:m.326110 g.326110  ORF g.326110 m.326110 type:complete len:530 (-) comp20396_c0_seq1:560-2149(-)
MEKTALSSQILSTWLAEDPATKKWKIFHGSTPFGSTSGWSTPKITSSYDPSGRNADKPRENVAPTGHRLEHAEDASAYDDPPFEPAPYVPTFDSNLTIEEETPDTVVLMRDSGSTDFGFSVGHAHDVTTIRRAGPAAKHLGIGDVIVKINDVTLDPQQHRGTSVQDIIRSNKTDFLRLGVRRKQPTSASRKLQKTTSTASSVTPTNDVRSATPTSASHTPTGHDDDGYALHVQKSPLDAPSNLSSTTHGQNDPAATTATNGDESVMEAEERGDSIDDDQSSSVSAMLDLDTIGNRDPDPVEVEGKSTLEPDDDTQTRENSPNTDDSDEEADDTHAPDAKAASSDADGTPVHTLGQEIPQKSADDGPSVPPVDTHAAQVAPAAEFETRPRHVSNGTAPNASVHKGSDSSATESPTKGETNRKLRALFEQKTTESASASAGEEPRAEFFERSESPVRRGTSSRMKAMFEQRALEEQQSAHPVRTSPSRSNKGDSPRRLSGNTPKKPQVPTVEVSVAESAPSSDDDGEEISF